MSQFDPRIHHRRSIRLKGYDYASEGMYYITLCVADRGCLFGGITDGGMALSAFGRIVDETWQWLELQYNHVELGPYVVMPNHLHGILILKTDNMSGVWNGSGNDVGGSRTAPTNTSSSAIAKRKTIGRLIGAFKTVSTKKINVLRGTAGDVVWQRDYSDHVIRNEQSCDFITNYIWSNPEKWESDKLYRQ